MMNSTTVTPTKQPTLIARIWPTLMNLVLVLCLVRLGFDEYLLSEYRLYLLGATANLEHLSRVCAATNTSR
jgi:hypothetical protein